MDEQEKKLLTEATALLMDIALKGGDHAQQASEFIAKVMNRSGEQHRAVLLPRAA